MDLDELFKKLEEGNTIDGFFTLGLNDDGNIELTLQVATEYNEAGDICEVETIVQEIPKAMINMAKMVGRF